MNDDYFSKEQVFFWASVAGLITAYFKYKTASLKQNGLVMESEKKGIKETKEVLVASNALAILIIKKLNDGIQVQDGIEIAQALFSDGEIKAAVQAAADKIGEVSGELKDLDMNEGIELAMYQAMQVPKIVEALKK